MQMRRSKAIVCTLAILGLFSLIIALLNSGTSDFAFHVNNPKDTKTEDNKSLIQDKNFDKNAAESSEDGKSENSSTGSEKSSNYSSGGSSSGKNSSGGKSSGGNASASQTSGTLALPSSSGALRVSGTKLVDARGNTVQLKGISTHGIAWYPSYINESCFRQLKQEWNVNVIRLAMYTEEYGGYCSGGDKANLKSLIHKGVTYATAQNMYVIIDWHILSDGNPNKHIDEAKAFFKEMSAKYKGYNNVIYEICNEPNGGVSWSQIKSYAEQVIGVIRGNDKDAIILVGTPNWSQYVDQAAANPITKYRNIMYTLHFYAATHTDSLRNTMVSAIKKGLPIFVSEYGICDASGNGAINEAQANKWVEVMNQYGVSYVAWNLSNKAETSAILNSSCNKTSGFKVSDLSSSGKWLYRMLTSGKTTASTTAAKAQTTKAQTAKSQQTTAKPSATTAPNATTKSTTKSATTAQKPSGTITFTANLVNQWESGGESFYHYTLTIHNRSGSACTQWTVEVPFNAAVVLTDSWNGNYSVSGKTIRISSKDYNGNIPAGGSIDNIGFIVKGSSGLKVMG